MRLAVIGMGYVGLPIAIKSVEAGHDVVGVDVGEARLQALRDCASYTEDVSDERLQNAWDTGRFTVQNTAQSVDFDIALITVPTPVDMRKHPDLSYIEAAAEYVAHNLQPGGIVVLESTTYPGTTEDVVAPIIERITGLTPHGGYYLGYSPERINPGDKVNTFDKVPKIVSGVGEEALMLIQAFYDTIVERTVPVSSPRAAELAKVFENTFAQVNIALVNEMALVCSELGLNVDEVLDAAATKGHAIMRFRPGPGVGGHCIAVDPLYLTWMRRHHYGQPFEFAELADRINSQMPEHVVNRARDLLSEQGKLLWEARILALGVAYKPGVADVRESPAVAVVERLQELGAHVTVADPHVHDAGHVSMATEMAQQADLVIVLTDHPEFEYTAIHERARLILDTRNAYTHGISKVHKL